MILRLFLKSWAIKDLYCNCWGFCLCLWVQTFSRTMINAQLIAEAWDLSQTPLMGALHGLESSAGLVSVEKKILQLAFSSCRLRIVISDLFFVTHGCHAPQVTSR